IDHILEGVSLYGFLNEIIRDIISNPDGLGGSFSRRVDNFFEIVKIQSALNLYKLRGEDMMESVHSKTEAAYKEGLSLYIKLAEIGSENKVDTIAYKLLSSLRVKDLGSFYDTLLRLYISLEKSVPKYFIDVFSSNSNIDIEALGYSFLIGLLSGKNYKNTKGGINNE
ncbi:MAG: type I-B CRISPR-associated protein Cas8b1/Cst1, partial [Dictyoglomus sp.]